mgnify:CR=1 FL=1
MVGIDALHYHVPNIYLPISALAEARNIEYPKLNKGLGLAGMSVPDVNEDVATMAAQAAINLIAENKIDLTSIGRIYLGTESALDAAKPTATYVVEMVENKFEPTFGKRALKNCDAVDLTFACVGAVDAMHNCLDWIRNNDTRKAIVIAADHAKYELNSTGEYTQGAGAVAMLLTSNPSILAIDSTVGVATESVNDFFKPRRTFSRSSLLQEAANLLGQELNAENASALLKSSTHRFWGQDNSEVEVHMDEPVFEGQYSNACYTNRIKEALEHFNTQKQTNFLKEWNQLIFHLPYAFQGRRMITPMWVNWMIENGNSSILKSESGIDIPEQNSSDWNAFVKACSKTTAYKTYVNETITKGEIASSDIGNMYTASIFMSLISYLFAAAESNEDLTGESVGFLSYGSGSKSKVFSGTVQPKWKEKVVGLNLFKVLKDRTPIDFKTYEQLQKKELKMSIEPVDLSLKNIGSEENDLGYRYYTA